MKLIASNLNYFLPCLVWGTFLSRFFSCSENRLFVSAGSPSSVMGGGLRKTDFISCSESCSGGDVNYELTASVRNMKLLDYTYRGRTYSRPGVDPETTIFGPTMRVKPGQSIWIKFYNNMSDPSLGPHPPTIESYWKMLENPGEKIKYQFYKAKPENITDMNIDVPNIPSHFDDTNLHLHGLDIQVHMFDPVNTHNVDAPHIQIKPQQCYCYRFDIPEDHPSGMYWYHPHLHGSTAVQLWGGMLGLLYVDGPLEEELASYGITHSEEFVIWDPAFKSVDKETHNLEVDDFLMGQTTLSKIHPFLVNGKMKPNFNTGVGEVLHFRTLCSTIENENTFIVYREGEETQHWDDAAIPFWVIGSDGVTYSRPRKRHIIVLSGGQREEILLKFDEPGRYVISQQGIEGMQFFDMYGHPHNQILATITVEENGSTASIPNIPIDDMRFTPGYAPEESIKAEDIVASESIVFSMGADRDKAPFPQYYVNGKPFHPNRIDFRAHPGEAREYILVNANHNAHPFHIHVNRFQVKEMGSELSIEKYPVLKHVLEFDDQTWRDTVMVPPNGRTRIWVQYKNYTGKTVIHCHFLAHEDTGMMTTLFIGPPDWIFRLEEHVQWIAGVLVGIFLAVLFVAFKRETRVDYSPVSMNEVKSKAMD